MSTLSGSISNVFNHAAKAALVVGGFVVGGYIGSLLFDPFFFPVIHDPTNLMGQAIKSFMIENFGFLHEWMGLTGSGGLLNMEPLKSVMAPYLAGVTPTAVAGVAGAAASPLLDMSADDIFAP